MQLFSGCGVSLIMKKALKKSGPNRPIAEIMEMLHQQGQQIDTLTVALERANVTALPVRKSKLKGPLGAVANYFIATTGDLRQTINQFLFPLLGYVFLRYYMSHMNNVGVAVVLSLLYGIPTIIFVKLCLKFWQSRQKIYQTQGALGAHNVQFEIGLVVMFAGVMEFATGHHSSQNAGPEAMTTAVFVLAGIVTMVYNYRKGKKLVDSQSREFPHILTLLRQAQRRRRPHHQSS